jgi:hypothetical protein
MQWRGERSRANAELYPVSLTAHESIGYRPPTWQNPVELEVNCVLTSRRLEYAVTIRSTFAV